MQRPDSLHFEPIYLNPEYCLKRGLTRFEAGAQGMHKVKRGLMLGLLSSLVGTPRSFSGGCGLIDS